MMNIKRPIGFTYHDLYHFGYWLFNRGKVIHLKEMKSQCR